MALIDTLKLAHALRDKGGFTEEAAEGTAQALNDALTGSSATKADIAELRGDLGGRVAAVEARITMLMGIVGLNFAATIAVLIKHW